MRKMQIEVLGNTFSFTLDDDLGTDYVPGITVRIINDGRVEREQYLDLDDVQAPAIMAALQRSPTARSTTSDALWTDRAQRNLALAESKRLPSRRPVRLPPLNPDAAYNQVGGGPPLLSTSSGGWRVAATASRPPRSLR
jgi:hypothetical protein